LKGISSSLPPTFFGTSRAVTQDLKSMSGDGKVVFLRNAGLDFLDFVISKLNNSTACNTPKMAMVFMPQEALIMEVTIFKIDLLDQSAFDKEGDSPVERGFGNLLLFVSEAYKEFIHVEMIMGRKDLLDDRLSLRRLTKALFLYKFPKSVNRIHDGTVIIEIQ
jgi:hypothetical protein